MKKRSLHILIIENEKIETTKAKEILKFAETRIVSRDVWKDIKEAVRLGEKLDITGDNIF